MKLSRDLLLRYILGECGADESRRIESAYFANPSLLGRLNSITAELVTAYVADTMPVTLRKRFERCLEAKPFIRKKVEKAKDRGSG